MTGTVGSTDDIMANATETTNETGRFSIPWDLSNWCEKSRLLDCLVEEIDTLDWSNPELVQLLRANPTFQPKFSLVLLTFAYANGNCESDEVVAAYFREPLLRARFPGQAPTAKGVSRFRRDHRGLLKWCLAQLFKRAFREKNELGDMLLPAGLRRYLEDAAGMRLDMARHFDRAAAGE